MIGIIQTAGKVFDLATNKEISTQTLENETYGLITFANNTKTICENCSGTGEIISGAEETESNCSACAGEGTLEGGECSQCLGTGIIVAITNTKEECPTCSGSGTTEIDISIISLGEEYAGEITEEILNAAKTFVTNNMGGEQ